MLPLTAVVLLGIAVAVAAPAKKAAAPFNPDKPDFSGQNPHWIEDVNSHCWTSSDNPRPGETVSWTGDCKDKLMSGEGTLIWSLDGRHETEIGTFVRGRMNGRGSILQNGTTLESDFHNGEATGHCSFAFADGSKLETECLKGKSNGHGVATYPNGGKLEVDYRDGKAVGHSVTTYPDGATLEVDYVNDLPNGHGVTTWPTGARLEADYKDGKRNGHLTMTGADGFRIEGDYADGREIRIARTGGKDETYDIQYDASGQGKGTYLFANGTRYVGGFAQGDVFSGYGEMTYANNAGTYKGSWANNQRSGQGVETLASHVVSSGNFRDGKLNGSGSKILANGDKYEGNFVDGGFSGQGTYTYKNNDAYSGEFPGTGTYTLRGTDYPGTAKFDTSWHFTYDRSSGANASSGDDGGAFGAIMGGLARGLAQSGRMNAAQSMVLNNYADTVAPQSSSGGFPSGGTSGGDASQCLPKPPKCAQMDDQSVAYMNSLQGSVVGTHGASAVAWCANMVTAKVLAVCTQEYRAAGNNYCASLTEQQQQQMEAAAAQAGGDADATSAGGDWRASCRIPN